MYVEGRQVDVIATEFEVLLTLNEGAGQVVRSSTLMIRVWGWPVSGDLLRMTVRRLHYRIEPDPGRPRYIHTVYGVGFMLRDAEAPPGPSRAPDEHS